MGQREATLLKPRARACLGGDGPSLEELLLGVVLNKPVPLGTQALHLLHAAILTTAHCLSKVGWSSGSLEAAGS